MQPPKLKYTINVHYSLAVDKNGKKFQAETMSLGDFQRNAKTDVALVELVGDLVSFQEPPALENKVLLLPKYEKLNIKGDLDLTHQLLIDREKVTFDGS